MSAYEIVNENSNKCLEVYRGSTGDGANVDQWGCNGGNHQYWVLDQVGTVGGHPADYIVNNNSAKCLDVYRSSFSNGANVDQWTCNNGYNQIWIDGESTYRYFQNYNSGKVLEVYRSSLSDGANVDQWTYNGGANQKWYIP